MYYHLGLQSIVKYWKSCTKVLDGSRLTSMVQSRLHDRYGNVSTVNLTTTAAPGNHTQMGHGGAFHLARSTKKSFKPVPRR